MEAGRRLQAVDTAQARAMVAEELEATAALVGPTACKAVVAAEEVL